MRLPKVERERRCPTSSTGQVAAYQSRSGWRQQRLQTERLGPVLCEASLLFGGITSLTSVVLGSSEGLQTPCDKEQVPCRLVADPSLDNLLHLHDRKTYSGKNGVGGNPTLGSRGPR